MLLPLATWLVAAAAAAAVTDGIYLPTLDGQQPRLNALGSCTAPEVMVNGAPSPDIAGTVSGGQLGSIEEIQFVGMVPSATSGAAGNHSVKQRRICKIKCLDGVWIGPLCAFQNADQFEPVLRSCRVPSIANGTVLQQQDSGNKSPVSSGQLPHGSLIRIKCNGIGLYRLTGEPSTPVRCIDGLWDVAEMPRCQPTTLHSNFSLSSAPSILYTLLEGTLGVEEDPDTGQDRLVILPGAILHLDCLFPETFGQPHWSVAELGAHSTLASDDGATEAETGAEPELRLFDYRQQRQHRRQHNPNARQRTHHRGRQQQQQQPQQQPQSSHATLNQDLKTHTTGWAILTDKHSWKYRLAIYYASEADTGRYSCSTPAGLANHIDIVVKDVQCPGPETNDGQVQVAKTGNRMHDRLRFSCPPGYRLHGNAEARCLANGQWSSPVASCQELSCPDPGTPANGQMIKATGRYLVGDYVQYQCRKGTRMQGEPILTCLHTERWSSVPPTCVPVCSYPAKLLHGHYEPVRFEYEIGQSVTIHCEPGYSLVREFSNHRNHHNQPSHRLTCATGGLWIGDAVKCKRTHPRKGRFRRLISIGQTGTHGHGARCGPELSATMHPANRA